MTTQCEFCDKPDVVNHLLECEMVLAHLFAGSTTFSCPDETTIQLVNTVKKVKKLPSLRWKNILELCKELRGISNHASTMMYT